MKGILLVTLLATLAIAASAFTRIQCPTANGEDVVLLPNPEDCTTYYSCANGIAYFMNCNEGLHFNAEQRVCDWPELARCESSVDPPMDDDDDNDDDDNDDDDDGDTWGDAEEGLVIDEPDTLAKR